MIRRVGTREVFANPWLRLREDAVEYPDGTPNVYTVVERKNFVTVLPWENDGFWIVEQYRYPLARRCWEFPQGTWPAGHDGTPAELAVAELHEETGLRADTFTHLGQLLAMPALMDQTFEVFLATGLTPGEPNREHTEQDMQHRWVSETELIAMVRSGQFADCHSLAAFALFRLVGFPPQK